MSRILRKIGSFLTSRVFLIGLAIVIQLAWFCVLLFGLSQYAYWINVALTILGLLIEIFIVSREGNPSYKILWLLFIGTLPVLGSVIYLFCGNKRPSRRMRRKMQHGRQAVGDAPKTKDVIHLIPQRTQGLCKSLASYGFPMYQNTEVKYYPVGDDVYPDLLEDLNHAQHYIFMEYFIIADGVMWESIKTILKQKASEGVDVRFVYDDIGSINCLPKKFKKDLEAGGVKVLTFNPFRPALSAVMNNRNHRKITAIDGYIAYTGGFNLADEYINQKERFGHWKDSAIRVYGDAAFSFTKMCLELWNAFNETEDQLSDYVPHRYHPDPFPSDGFVQPYCNSPFEHETLAQSVYIDLLYEAKSYAWIFTPYLSIDDEMQHALSAAAARGVDVRIVTPGIPDKKVVYTLTRSYYEPLLHAGIKIYEYTPGFIHAKSYLIDDNIGIVGTINMDYRGLYLHMECAALMVNCSMLAKLKEDYLQTFKESKEIALSDCKRHRHSLLWQALLRTISPLL